ncbi:long-chain fatty acid--CoA ligase [Nocardia sp. BSTN01]|uniref:class I adenylate-forming enzyme family protein n=1 Tax=Nocardia sp. BSTN01 TaxID=2783665 RepID=UPI00188F996B|nr:fatty acid--CoA ligase family protein [Nocardia sp. BSTN01]MBF4997277.1 long-chain fatty acid--CoA ligase [Nocardia sp. BSTN01]
MGISMLLEAAASTMPDRVLIGAGDTATTAQDLAGLAGGGAAVLAAAGVDAVGYIGVGGRGFPVSLFAAAAAGLPFTPLNYRLSGPQLTRLAAGLGRRPYLIVDEQYLDVLDSVPGVVTTTREWLSACATDPIPPRDVDDEHPAVVLYTSGTTSEPKGAVLRHEHLVSYVLQTVEFASAEPTDAALISVPPYHIAGVGTVLTNAFAGRRTVYLPNFDPAEWIEIVAGERITQTMLVPTMLARIVDHLGEVPVDLSSLRSIAYGGARMPQRVLEQALSLFPQVAFTNAYGLTETSSTIAVLGPDDHREALASTDPAVRARLHSAGRLVPGVEGQIRDATGAALAPGEIGELWVRGAQVSGEYLGSGSVLDADGWFHTRDRAHLDEAGYLFISGRTDDTIIRGGENIAPAEIEDVLGTHPAVKDVAVVGLPDDEWGARIVAAVVALRDVGADELRDFVRARLRGSRTPDEVVFRADLPCTPTGKVIRRELVADLLRSEPADAK